MLSAKTVVTSASVVGAACLFRAGRERQWPRPWLAAAAVYGVAAAWLVRYFRAYSEDPKLATPDMFPRVPNPRADEVAACGTEPFTNTDKKFLVIGAGFVGLGTAGGLCRHQIPFDMVEREAAVGGNWRYGVYDTVHIISSRDTTEFKDVPMPKHYPHFPSARQMRDYLTSYADHYDLHKVLRCNVTVVSCTPVDGGRQGWDVVMDQAVDGATKRLQLRYKGVLCALGHHWCMRMPDITGSDSFTGRFCHAKQIRSPAVELKDKRVLVIGGGNSACDLAAEAGKHGAKSAMSLRRGVWFIPRTMFGIPVVDAMSPWTPMWLQRIVLRTLCRIVCGSYTKYGFPEPDCRPFDTHPTINSDVLHMIQLGRIVARKGVKRFAGGNVVEFTDGTSEEYDVVIAATGYNYSVPMIPQHLLEYRDGIPQLYGAFIPGCFNLAVLVGSQVRYGAGPVITSSAQAIGHLLKAQHGLKHSLGAIMQAAGQKPMTKSPCCSDVLEDPILSWNRTRRAAQSAHKLGAAEAWLARFGKLPKEPLVAK